MATNQLYVASRALEEILIDKTTGLALANGTIEFYKDNDRNTPKNVYEKYQKSGAPPNYDFEALPNPLNLSGGGTIVDADNNNVTLYYLPYESDEAGSDVELYYVVVKDSDGNVQFTREGWPPNIGAGDDPFDAPQGSIVNMLDNSQFVDVLFDPDIGLSVDYTGNDTTTVTIAPNWTLEITHNDAGTLTVARNAIDGNANKITNPPYTLTITPGNNIDSLKLYQRLSDNPNIWSPVAADTRGYLNGGVLLGSGSNLQMNYNPSNGTSQEILDEANIGADLAYFSETIQLIVGDNPDAPSSGYVDIEFVLPVGTATTLSSAQLVGLEADDAPIYYQQAPANRQKDQTFNYYNPLLKQKPIPSYLKGWDFPLNPAQFLTEDVAAQAVGANKSYYAWDQTILFQTTDSGITVSRGANGSFKTLSATAAGTQIAVIQYLEQAEARKLLNSRKCVNVAANASTATTATVSLWYTTDAQLPDLKAANYNSLVSALDANGHPTADNGNWTEVGRSNLGNAQFSIGTSDTTEFNDYPLAGWDLEGAADTDNATYFAIVVGTANLAQNDYIEWFSISLQDGDIPTRPAPQTPEQVLSDVQHYYRMSFLVGTQPAQNAGFAGATFSFQGSGAAAANNAGPSVNWEQQMRASPTVTLYNPAANNAQIRNTDGAGNWSGSTVVGAFTNAGGFFTRGTTAGGSNEGNGCAVHWTADARLGRIL